jgi:hypothetical protein
MITSHSNTATKKSIIVIYWWLGNTVTMFCWAIFDSAFFSVENSSSNGENDHVELYQSVLASVEMIMGSV